MAMVLGDGALTVANAQRAMGLGAAGILANGAYNAYNGWNMAGPGDFHPTRYASPRRQKPKPRQPKAKQKSKQRQRDVQHTVLPGRQVNSVRTGKPKMRPSVQGSIRLTHREYVRDVIAHSGDGVKSVRLPVAAGMSETFSWLASLAPSFRSFRFKRVTFNYVHSCGQDTPGIVTIASTTDTDATAPENKADLGVFDNANRGVSVKDFSLTAKVSSKKLKTTARSFDGLLPSEVDQYVGAVAYLVTHGCADSTSVLGELYVDYDIELMDPVGATCPHFLTARTGVDTTHIFGDSTSWAKGDLGITLSPTGRMTFQRTGKYMVTLTFHGTGGYITDFFFSGVGGDVKTDLFTEFKASSGFAGGSLSITCDVGKTDGSVDFSLAGILTGADVYVCVASM